MQRGQYAKVSSVVPVTGLEQCYLAMTEVSQLFKQMVRVRATLNHSLLTEVSHLLKRINTELSTLGLRMIITSPHAGKIKAKKSISKNHRMFCRRRCCPFVLLRESLSPERVRHGIQTSSNPNTVTKQSSKTCGRRNCASRMLRTLCSAAPCNP